MRVILAGGGTGGHVIPAIAIAQQLKKDCGAEILFIGTSRGIENRLVPAAGFELRRIEVGALKNVSLATRLGTFVDIPRAVWQSRGILRAFRPDVVIGVGGYASGPFMLAAILSKVPTMAFEPNFVPGLANRLVAPFVKAAAVHFAETGKYFRNCEVTGVPVRAAFFSAAKAQPDASPTLLVFGGSQGAHAINQVMMESAADLLARFPGLSIIHQTGERDYNDAQAVYSKCGDRIESYRFIDDMPAMFARAGLLICRSGASTVAEVAAAGKPAIFVPFPAAADDHQKRNAEAMERAGAAVLLEQSRLTRESLYQTVNSLMSDVPRMRRMGEAAQKMSHSDAAARIAQMAVRVARLKQ